MKVFLSSTAQDLVEYRQVADDTILRLSQQAVVMERFGPMPTEPVAECERKARESDVVVCIVAHRYGFEPEKGCGSITRREVQAAKEEGKNVLVSIVADNHPWMEKKEQDPLTDPAVRADPEQVLQVAANVTALVEFKAWLQKTFVCDTFTTPDELGRKIAVALSTYSAQRTASPAAPAPKQREIRIVHALWAVAGSASGIQVAVAGVMRCDPGDQNFEQERASAGVGCGRSSEARSEMSVFTIGENIGRPGCEILLAGVSWRPIFDSDKVIQALRQTVEVTP